MGSYHLTHKAVKDLKQIWLYTFEQWSEKQADTYYMEILQHCEKVAKNPAVGRSYHYVVDDVRGSKVNKHIIFYRPTDLNAIEIIRILHERMDLVAKLTNQ